MVSKAVYRKALEIANRGDVMIEKNRSFTVYRRDTDTWADVYLIDGRWYSTGKHFCETGRHDTYITAAKIAVGRKVKVD